MFHCDARRIRALCIMGVALLVGGCPYQSPKPRTLAKPPIPRHALEAGKSEVIEFPADGRWHPSPLVLLDGQVVVLQPVGVGAAMAGPALRFKVGQVPQMMKAGEAVRITIPGPLDFKVDPRMNVNSSPGAGEAVRVEIKRVQ